MTADSQAPPPAARMQDASCVGQLRVQNPSSSAGLARQTPAGDTLDESLQACYAIAKMQGYDATWMQAGDSSVPVEAWIDLKNWCMTINTAPDLEDRVTRALQSNRQRRPRSRYATVATLPAIGRMLETITRHELGHWEFCPGSSSDYVAILDACASVDSSNATVVANMFTDTIVNTHLTQEMSAGDRFLDGLGLVYLVSLHKRRRQPTLSLFLGIMLGCITDDAELLDLSGKYRSSALAHDGIALFRGTDYRIGRAWPLLARQYAALFQRLQQDNANGASSSGVPRAAEKRINGNALPGLSRPLVDPQGREYWEAVFALARQGSTDNTGDQEDGREDHTAKLGATVEAQGQQTGAGGRDTIARDGDDPAASAWAWDTPAPGSPGASLLRPSILAQDWFFRLHAQKVCLRAQLDDAPTRTIYSTGHLVDDEHTDGRRMRWGRTLYLPATAQGQRLLLTQREGPVPLPAPGTERMPQLPDIAFIIDSSGSMGYRPFDLRCPYGLLLLACYSVLRHLDEKNAPIRTACVNFSSTTKSSGWQERHNQHKMRKTLLAYEGAGTILDISALSKLDKATNRPYWQLLVTDSGLGNTAQASGYLCQTRNRVTLLQIGDPTVLSKALDAAGRQVAYVHAPEQITGMLLEQAVSIYG